MATFVLIPAAWCGGWCWNKVGLLLREAGHAVHTPTPTGLGERVHLAHAGIDLDTHITDILNVLIFEDLADVTLVGWSYGGMIATGVADRAPERLARLVYIDSEVPEDGQSIYDAASDDGSMRAAYQDRIMAAGTPGFLPFRTDGIEGRVPDEADRAWMLARIVPHPIATLEQPIRLRNPLAARLPRAFILCTESLDPGEPEPPVVARARSDPDWRFFELAANHLAPINNPRATANALLTLV